MHMCRVRMESLATVTKGVSQLVTSFPAWNMKLRRIVLPDLCSQEMHWSFSEHLQCSSSNLVMLEDVQPPAPAGVYVPDGN